MTQTEQKAFPLRLPISTRNQAAELAKGEGISLNGFITIAVAEKIARMQLLTSTPRGGAS